MDSVFSSNELQRALANTLMKWVRGIDFLPNSYEIFEQLADATIFSKILLKVDEDFFHQTAHMLESQNIDAKEQNWAVNLSRLKSLLEKLDQYYQKRYNQFDVKTRINVLALAKDGDLLQLLKYFSLIARLIMDSECKDEFIGPVLELSEDEQEVISEYFQILMQETTVQTQQMQSVPGDPQLLEKLVELENENSSFLQKLGQQNEEIQHLQTKLSAYEQEIQDRDKQISKLKTEVQNQHIEELEQKKSQNQELKKKLWSCEHQIKEYQEQIGELQLQTSQIELMKQEMDQLKKRLNQQQKLEQKIDMLKEQNQIDRQNMQREFDDQEHQKQKLTENYKTIFEQYNQEKDKSLSLELEKQKLCQEQQEILFESEQKEAILQQQIKDLKLRLQMTRTETEVSRTTSVANNVFMEDKQELLSDQQNNHNAAVQLVEENYKKEIMLLREKIKSLEYQVNSQNIVQEKLEGKNKELERQISGYKDKNDKYKKDNQQEYQKLYQKQQEQIQLLTTLLNDFKKKYNEVKGEHKKMWETLSVQ